MGELKSSGKSFDISKWEVQNAFVNCFSAIPHEKLMQAVEEHVCDTRPCSSSLGAMLRAGVVSEGMVRGELTGTPQARAISPLMCNVYRHQIDGVWHLRAHASSPVRPMMAW